MILGRVGKMAVGRTRQFGVLPLRLRYFDLNDLKFETIQTITGNMFVVWPSLRRPRIGFLILEVT